MTFLNDLWKKFKAPPADKAEETAVIEQVLDTSLATTRSLESLKQQDELLNIYQEIETEKLQRETVLNNLKALKEITEAPPEENLELRFAKIKEHLHTPESYETLRQERWYEGINCPNCQSKQLKRLPPIPPQSPHKHRYLCLACNLQFDDESGTPFGTGIPPLNIWMQCWYLMGCTDSLPYIAARLNLDLNIIELMVVQLRRIFNTNKPLVKNLDFEAWNKQATDLRKQLSEDLIKQYETLNANIATAPKDTTEFRRQQNLRRTLRATTEPPTPTKPFRRPT